MSNDFRDRAKRGKGPRVAEAHHPKAVLYRPSGANGAKRDTELVPLTGHEANRGRVIEYITANQGPHEGY